MALEFEYGATSWWTSELYLDGLTTRSQGTCFTGYRWENRFRPFREQHWINPVFYTEFENIDGADRVLLEIVGHDGVQDLIEPVGDLRREKEREIETKLILTSYFKGWTLAENLIAVKDVSNVPWEFGYTIGIARPLSFKPRSGPCAFCPQAFDVGVEAYGAGSERPLISAYTTPPTTSLRPGLVARTRANLSVVPTFGLTDTSARFLLRVGVSYEIDVSASSCQLLSRLNQVNTPPCPNIPLANIAGPVGERRVDALRRPTTVNHISARLPCLASTSTFRCACSKTAQPASSALKLNGSSPGKR